MSDKPRLLPAEACTASYRPQDVPEGTDEGTPADRMAPQARAIDALRHGLSIPASGFHIAVVGARGTGRTFTALALAEAEASDRLAPRDLVLLPNPHGPLEPQPVFLPPGTAPRFIRAMEDLHNHLQGAFHDTLQGHGRNRLALEVERERSATENKVQSRLSKMAERYGLALVPGSEGYEFVPIGGSEDASASAENDTEQPDNQLWLPTLEQRRAESSDTEQNRRYLTAIEHLTPHVEEARRELELLAAQSDAELVKRQRETLRRQVETGFASIPGDALPTEEVRRHVRELHAHLLELYHLEQGNPLPLSTAPIEAGLVVPTLLTTSEGRTAAPIVRAQNPTLAGIFGRVVTGPEESRYLNPGTILAGDLHHANGGFLIVEAEALVKRARVYEHLKSCLLANAILPLEEGEGQILRPHAIELDLKLILIADPDLIQQLQELDPEFGQLFKVRADFSEDMSREHALTVYPRLCAWLASRKGLPPCDRPAVAKLLTHGARLAEDQDRATAELGRLADVVTEAAWLANRPTEIGGDHIEAALAASRERDGQLRDRILHLHEKGAIRVQVEGGRVGQLNGLAVVSDGFAAIGRPMRVTAVTYAGTAGPLNVEREVELSGPLHSKGVLILTGYLSDRFARLDPPSFGASVVFEQTYSPVEGDSASMVELLAILSSLADAPARQDMAVTGGVDQQGRALPVGGVNEKVEGFFDLCNHLGLTGGQGVIIPEQNVRNLVLRDDVLTALTDGRFHIWAVDSVEEAAGFLLGLPAGTAEERDGSLHYPEHTLYGRIQQRLERLRRRRRAYSTEAES